MVGHHPLPEIQMTMKRRQFNALIGGSVLGGLTLRSRGEELDRGTRFKSLFAPHPGLLPTAPEAYLDEMRFAYDLGFRAWEDNGFANRGADLQEKVGAFARGNNMTLGVSVITNGAGMVFSKPTEKGMAQISNDLRKGIELAGRTGQTHMTMLPGIRVPGQPVETQIEGAVDMMKRCCDIVEGHGIVFVLEPLSHDLGKAPPLLRSFEDGHKLCELVGRECCKLLADFYHEGQIGHGDKLIENAEKAWSQVAYVQFGDSPGRKEPGSGGLDYPKVTAWLREKGYTGVIGMEHGASGTGRQGLDKLLAAYRRIDA
jgi:hydroxypyruvate isomerase